MLSWREDIKKCLMQSGLDQKYQTFLFVDTQIIDESQLEDLNSILNSGDVTNLYKPEDLEEIYNMFSGECIKKGLQPNNMNMFQQYLLSLKRHIHMVIAMSPVGDAYTDRLRRFPSFVNCSTIDWFTAWPKEALIGVGVSQITEDSVSLGIADNLENIVNLFQIQHRSVEQISDKYRDELRRYNYVTPTSYLELLKIYKAVLKDKKEKLKN